MACTRLDGVDRLLHRIDRLLDARYRLVERVRPPL